MYITRLSICSYLRNRRENGQKRDAGSNSKPGEREKNANKIGSPTTTESKPESGALNTPGVLFLEILSKSANVVAE